MIVLGERRRVIDIHIHIQPWNMLKPEVLEGWKRNQPDFENLLGYAQDPGKFLRHLDAEGVERTALINYVSPDVMGFSEETNQFISDYCKADPHRLIPVGSLHPHYVDDAKTRMSWLVEDLGIKMIKIHPSHQLLYPNEYLNGLDSLAVIYEKAEEYGMPIMFHTGTSIFPAARTKYSDPIYLEDVALDFPRLKIILAHGGRPLWMDTAFFLLRRFPNMYLDISGIPPKGLLEYLPRVESIAHKTMFGTDWPGPGVLSIRDNIDAIESLDISEESKNAILYDTANAFLNDI